jgi:hypothetical protein
MSITVSGLERNCGLDQHIEHFAFEIDGAPKIDDAAIQVTTASGVPRRKKVSACCTPGIGH